MKKLILSAKKKPTFDKSRRSFLQYTGTGILTTSLFLAGCSDDDEPGIQDIAAPSNLTAEQNDAGEVELNFTDNSEDEDGFIIERSESMDGTFVEVGTLGASTTAFTDNNNLAAGTEYFYRVAATRGNEQSVFSNVASSMGGSALVSLGSGDVGILNYAYALEQLEAAFYTQIMENNFFSGATDEEMRILEDLRKHEVAHRDFFQAAISTVADPIPGLMVDFSAVDFDSRDSVLATAKTFENLGVAAYNGAGKLLESQDFLVVAGKIVSVEARHAAAISDLIDPMTTAFVDVVNAQGLDQAMMPSEVLAAADPFILTRIDASNLPTA
jgi:hypothetical protein